MADPRTIRFYDYYQAHIAADLLRAKGHRAEVFDYGLTFAFWPSAGFRVDVFQNDGEEAEPGTREPPTQGALGRIFDDLLRTLAQSIVLSLPVIGLGIILQKASRSRTPQPPGSFGWADIFWSSAGALVVGLSAIFAVCAYRGYRRGARGWTVFIQLTGLIIAWAMGGTIVLTFLLVLALAEIAREPGSGQA